MRLYQELKNIYHLFEAVLANVVFGFPSRRIKIIGVTGTNGKTTTVWMINKILEEAGAKTAVSSTINFKIGENEWVNKTKFTTRSAWEVQSFIKQSAGAGCEYLVMEVSSHALDQNRVWGTDFAVAVITNITREHLDYHGTMEEYKNAKLKLFKRVGKNSKFEALNPKQITNSKSQNPNSRIIVVNLVMEWAGEFLSAEADKKYGYFVEIPNNKLQIPNKYPSFVPFSGTSEGKQKTKNKYEKIIAEDIKLNSEGSEFMLSAKGGPASGWQKFMIHLPGEFNIENALVAVCVGLSQNINLKTCARALAKIKKIPGRMDYVENDRGLKIIIDYALTPDSMEKLGSLISDLRFSNDDLGKQKNPLNPPLKKGEEIEQKKPKVIWVFGACGERDRGKRPMMGKIVAKYADVIIVTNEDPYGEEAEVIINEILKGIVDDQIIEDGTNFQLSTRLPNEQVSNFQSNSKSQISNNSQNKTAWKILDRKEAIKKALEVAHEGDIILITGKGAEETMAIGKERIPWNDRKVAEDLLGKIQDSK